MRERVRSILSIVLGGLLTAGLSTGAARAEDPSLVVSSWGGAFTKATTENLLTPFSAETGIKFQVVDAASQHLAQVQAQESSGKVTWDVIDSLDASTAALMYKRGLLEKLPPEVKKVLEENSAPGMVTDYGVMQSSIASPYICNNEKVKACPQNAADFFDVEKFPGDRSAYNNPYDMLVMAFYALGVKDRTPTPQETDQAFALVQKVQPSLRTLWESADQSSQLMRSGEVSIMAIWNRPARRLVEENPGKWTVVWKDAGYEPAYTVVIKNAPHKENAFKYLEWYATHPKQQAKWASTTSYGVASAAALKEIDPEAVKWLPESHLKDLAPGNIQWWLDNTDALVKRWRQVIGG